MKKLEVEHKGIHYELEYMEESRIIVVVKAGVPTYKIKVLDSDGQLTFSCDCPGRVWHDKCWHIDGDDTYTFPPYGGPYDVLSQDSINEPWTEWAEEAVTMNERRD